MTFLYPEQKWIGYTLVAIGMLIFLFGIRIEGWGVKFNKLGWRKRFWYFLSYTPLDYFQGFVYKKIEQNRLLKQDASLSIEKINTWREQARLGIKLATGKDVFSGNAIVQQIAVLYQTNDAMLAVLDRYAGYLEKLLREITSADLEPRFNPADLRKY